MKSERDEMRAWLDKHCPFKVEWDFWYQLYDDLEDCFDELEPWRVGRLCNWDWQGWDEEFTGQRIAWTDEDEALLIPVGYHWRDLLGE